MKLNELKLETKELVANSLGIYYALEQKNKLYRKDDIACLSLYSGALRMGQTTLIKWRRPITTAPGTGYPYANIKEYENGKAKYKTEISSYDNIVCKILNNHGITIEKVTELLLLDKKILEPVSALKNRNLENQYNNIYKDLLQTIKNYYIVSAQIANNLNASDKPEVEMDIPNIISALYYPNINPYNSVSNLQKQLNSKDNDLILKEIENYSNCKLNMCHLDEQKQPQLYQTTKKLIMNKNIGKII